MHLTMATVKVEMGIPQDAVRDVERLTDQLHMASETDTVVAAIRLMRAIVESAGGKGSRVDVMRPHSRRITSVDINPLFARSPSSG